MRKLVRDAGLNVEVDSCGTAGWHIGKSPDPRAMAEATAMGYDLSALRARQLNESDFDAFDFIFAMDDSNLRNIQSIAPTSHHAVIQKFTELLPTDHPMFGKDVPDPYYEDNFPEVLSLIEEGPRALVTRLQTYPHCFPATSPNAL